MIFWSVMPDCWHSATIIQTEGVIMKYLKAKIRELLSKVQNTRKTTGFDVNDTVKLYVEGDDEVSAMVHKFEDYIKTEVLATDVIYSVDGVESAVEDINGHSTRIAVVKNI